MQDFFIEGLQFGMIFLGEGTPKLEQREHGWYDYNYVMDRDGQVLFQTKNNRWRIRGIKMTRAQIKREIKQQILDIERLQQAKN